MTFADFLQSSAYTQQAEMASKASVILATGTCLFVMLFQDWGFGFWWLLIVPALWFLASVLMAMPITLVRFWVAYSAQSNPAIARIATGAIDVAGTILQPLLVFYGLRALYNSVW